MTTTPVPLAEQPTLLPCPFCGPGESIVEAYYDDLAHRYRVGCGRCGCSTGTSPRDKGKQVAVDAWNRRNPAFATLQQHERTMDAMRESFRLQSHYAALLNMHDGGNRRVFESVEEWIDRFVENAG